MASGPPQNTAALGAGFGVGILWVIMAVTSLWSSVRGFANNRDDWGFAWGLVGILMLTAGIGAMVATWWHLTHHAESDEH